MFLLAKYGVETVFRFPIIKRAVADFAATADWTPATGDTKVSKDGGNFANTTNNPAATGGTGSVGWTLTLTATELTAAEIDVQIVDSATKAVEDQWLTVYTYGNASAKIPMDLSDLVHLGITALPNAAAEAAGGLITRGTGAGQVNQDAAGRMDVNVAAWKTGVVATPNSTGVPKVDVVGQLGVAPAALDGSGYVQASVATMQANTITATATAADCIDASALSTDAVTEIINAIKAAVIETQGSYTIQQALSIMLSVLAGITSNSGATLKTPDGVATRVAATIDGSNNRTAMTVTPSA